MQFLFASAVEGIIKKKFPDLIKMLIFSGNIKGIEIKCTKELKYMYRDLINMADYFESMD
ncbi:MAG: hypothetical protein ACXAC7_15470 [Candidatus Hodarchaeales archaeon]|jgi:hypothetical protein